MSQGGKTKESPCPLALRLGDRTFLFPPRGKFRIGSRGDVDLALPELTLEDVHCEVFPSSRGIKVVDRSGRTFLEGDLVEEVDLSPGMRLFLGQVPLEVILQEEAERAYLVGPGRKRGDLSLALRRYQKAKGPTLAEEIRRKIRSAPWFTLSLAAHAVLLFLLWNFPFYRTRPALRIALTSWEAPLENQVPPGSWGEAGEEEPPPLETPSPELPLPEPFLETRLSPTPLETPGIYLGLRGGSMAEEVIRTAGVPGGKKGGAASTTLTPRLTGTTPVFRQKIAVLRKKGMDVVLVMDATASMTFGLQLARSTLLDILYAQASLVPDNRTALLVFRDREEDPSSSLPAPVLPLSRNPWAAMNFLEILSAGGGGKPRESLLSPLKRAFSLFSSPSKRRRLVLLVGDAPGRPEEEKELRELVRRFHGEEGGFLCALYTGPPVERSPFKGEALEEFRTLAGLGGGRCVSLKDKPSTIREVLALLVGEKDKKNVDRFLVNLEKRPPAAVRVTRRKLIPSDPGWILGRLASDPVPVGLVREILRRPDPGLLAGLLAVLEGKEDSSFPLAGRQAVLYILRRALPPFPLSPEEILEGRLDRKTFLFLKDALDGKG